MAPRTVTAEQARRFLVARQLLSPPRSLPPTEAGVMAAIDRLGSLQFDPLETPGARNHDLVLHARVAGYRRSLCDGLLYGPPGERALFEAYNKSLNILPVAEIGWHRHAWARAGERHREGILKERARLAGEILSALDERGPLTTQSFGKGEKIGWHWAPTSEHRAVLEALFETGKVGISRREGSRRFFDRIERLLPEEALAKKASVAEAQRHRLLSRYRAVGLLGARGQAEIFVGTGEAAERRAHLARLVREGLLTAVTVAGLSGERYVLSSELDLLERSRHEPPSPPSTPSPPAVAFLAPLDPLCWDRGLLRDLFGFDYLWEVYTPEEKRRWGYYVLPLLYGDRLIGRIEPRLDRAERALTLTGIWLEEGVSARADRALAAAFGEALSAYASFVGAERIRWPRSRSGEIKALREASGG